MNETPAITNDIETLKHQLQQLRELHSAGTLSQAAYDAARGPLEQHLLQQVLNTPQPARTSPRLRWALGAVIVAIAAAGYWWTGSPSYWTGASTGASTSRTAMGSESADTSAPHATDPSQMNALVEGLATRLKSQPDDGEGWAMLARSYAVVGRSSEALSAYDKATRLLPKDADLMADYADALAAQQDRRVQGAPMKWVERALKINPNHIKALALAGTAAWERQDYKAATKYWQRLADQGKPDDEIVRQMAPALAQAREKLGLPQPSVPVASSGAQAPTSSAQSGKGSAATLSGTITLSPALAQQASPTDTVFIYARDASGNSRMPLAILRKQVRDLPLRYTLDDSLAMSPAAKLSSASSVVVEARVSKSGEAKPQAGDLRGTSAATAPSRSGVDILIGDVIRP